MVWSGNRKEKIDKDSWGSFLRMKREWGKYSVLFSFSRAKRGNPMRLNAVCFLEEEDDEVVSQPNDPRRYMDLSPSTSSGSRFQKDFPPERACPGGGRSRLDFPPKLKTPGYKVPGRGPQVWLTLVAPIPLGTTAMP